MRTKIRRRFRAALAVIMAVCILCAIPLAANADSVVLSGTCGTNTRWELFSDNVLVLSCGVNSDTAQTGDFTLTSSSPYETNAPWAQFYDYTNMKFMQKIVLADGITSIGNYCFYMKENNSYKVDLINLCDSLETIGQYAFANEKGIQSIAIPQNVESIGAHAFDGTSSLDTVNCYADPSKLTWDIGVSGLKNDCKIHVMSKHFDAYKTKFSAYADRFIGDLTEPTNIVPKGKNILISYEEVSDSIFGGALPYSIKAVNSKGTWPITYGARGFVTCLKDGNNYYALTDNNSGALSLLGIDSTSGKALHTLTDSQYQNAAVKLSHEYIGANSVKVIYNVKNLTNEDMVFTLGSSGDIKIGLDDKAAITPLKIDDNEIGITMTSTNSEDKIEEKYPTLGFAGKKVGGSAVDSTYFYGQVGANKTQTATAVKSDIFIPERIFSVNNSSPYQSQTTGNLSGVDSGLSFYWDVSLKPNEEKQYAVIFSVPNTESGHANDTVIEEVKSNFSTNTDGFYTAGNKTIFFNNEVTPGSDDTLADKNNYDTLKNFLLLGVQKKISEHDGGSSLRYVTVVNTDILKDADEYGYIIAQTSKSKSDINTEMIAGIKYDNTGIYKKDIKGSSNTISGDYGKYNSDTHYKYVTLGIDDILEDNKTLVVRFYVKKGNKISYAKYFNTKGEELDGCAASYNDVINAANAQGGNG